MQQSHFALWILHDRLVNAIWLGAIAPEPIAEMANL
jgi:hypothetical protein